MNRSMAAADTIRLPPTQMLSSRTPLQPLRHHRQIVEMCGFLPLWCHNLVFAVVGEVVAPLVINSNRVSETVGKAGLTNVW